MFFSVKIWFFKIFTKFKFQDKIIKFLKMKITKYCLIFLNIINLSLYVLIYNRQSDQIESTICQKIKLFSLILNLFILDVISFVINLVFLLETCLSVASHPRSLFKIWQIANIFLVLCSIFSLYFNVIESNYETSHSLYNSFLVSVQIFRFFLIMKHVKILKKILKTFRRIIIKSFPIILLFFLVLFFYGLIGNLLTFYLNEFFFNQGSNFFLM